MKKFSAIILTVFVLMISGCNAEHADTNSGAVDSGSITDETSAVFVNVNPTTNDELFEYVMDKWQQNETADLYYYADSELTDLLSKKDFIYLFDSVSKIRGELKSFSELRSSSADGIVTYSAKLDFDNITADISLAIRDLKICAFTRNIYFKNEFEIQHESNVAEKHFVLENDGYKLNAVYTYVNDGNSHPAVLLIAGSGPSDYNETLGILTPFEDIALGLAENGINSLRVDKRTFGYGADFDMKCGIEEEYLDDCNAAIEYLKSQNISGIYLFGHSLGGQIATELAASNTSVDGMILFNSSARHLADIACDQYSAIDPGNKESYITYADAAKNAAFADAKGYFYYSASDYYWASYNQIDVAKNIIDTNIKTLIINSRSDKQAFDEDIDMWYALVDGEDNISISIFDDISHFGYRIDTTDTSTLYKRIDFPSDIILVFSEFISQE